MKPLLRIFDLSKNEQRVVLVVILFLVAIAFVGYERRVHRVHGGAPTVPEVRTSPSPVPTEDEH